MSEPNQDQDSDPSDQEEIEQKNSVVPEVDSLDLLPDTKNRGMRFEISTTSNPLPEPEKLQQYNQLGVLDKAIEMIQKEQDHRHQQEEREQLHRHQQEKQQQEHSNQLEQDLVKNDEKSINLEHKDRTLGQVFGLIIGLFTVFTGGYVAVNGSQWAGSFIGAGGVAGLTAVFVKGRVQKPQEEKTDSKIRSNRFSEDSE